MKKVTKTLLTLLVLITVFLLQRYLIEKPQEKQDDKNEVAVELIRVVDGDTLILRIEGQKEKVRLIGMNAPESVKPNSPVECFGREASQHAKEIIKNKKLQFKNDSSQDRRDRFGRLLGYVFMDEKNFAEQMIRDGYAYEYTYQKSRPYRYQYVFRKAEREARRQKRGLWADGACDDY